MRACRGIRAATWVVLCVVSLILWLALIAGCCWISVFVLN